MHEYFCHFTNIVFKNIPFVSTSFQQKKSWGTSMQDHDPSDISTKNFLNPLKRMRVIIRTSTDGVG